MRSDKANPTLGKVIRPAISRWLHKRVEFFRSEKSSDHTFAEVTPGDSCTRVVVPLHDSEPTDIAALQAQIEKASAKIAQLETDLALNHAKASAVASNLNKTRLQSQRAVERLLKASEPVPESSANSLSMLQESYINFTVAVELQEQKHEDLLLKIERLDDSHKAQTAVIKDAQAKILCIENAASSNEDNFKLAA